MQTDQFFIIQVSYSITTFERIPPLEQKQTVKFEKLMGLILSLHS